MPCVSEKFGHVNGQEVHDPRADICIRGDQFAEFVNITSADPARETAESPHHLVGLVEIEIQVQVFFDCDGDLAIFSFVQFAAPTERVDRSSMYSVSTVEILLRGTISSARPASTTALGMP